MEPIANETWKSFLRSRYRRRLLLLIASMGEVYVGQAGRILHQPHSRIMAMLVGSPGRGYSESLSLVRLGLVQERVDAQARGRVFEITSRGRRKARSLAAARARRAQAVADPPRVEKTAMGATPAPAALVAELAGDGSCASWSVSG